MPPLTMREFSAERRIGAWRRWSRGRDGIAYVAVALLLGCLVWLAADLWDARRGREVAEEANREREYDRLAAEWPREPGR